MVFWREILRASQLDEVLDKGADGRFALILKHSYRCGLSSMAKSRIERLPDPRLDYYVIDVVNNRDISRKLSEFTGVQHESPQAFLFEGARLIEVKSHMAISPAEVPRRLDLIAQI